MLTKKQFAQAVLDKSMQDEGLKEFSPNLVLKSTSAGIAAEYLGILKNEELLDYLASRGGMLYTHVDEKTAKLNYLTMREMLEILPESVDSLSTDLEAENRTLHKALAQATDTMLTNATIMGDYKARLQRALDTLESESALKVVRAKQILKGE